MAYHQQRRVFDFILPFLIFISIGIIIVLSIQLWNALKPPQLESEAYLYIDSGKTQILPWGLDQWEQGINGSRILQGDSIKTSSQGRAIIQFYDGSILRLGSKTEINIEQLDQSTETYHAKITLINGQAWINTNKIAPGSSEIQISTQHLRAVSKEATFAMETNPNETANLIAGKLEVSVIIPNEENEKVAEKIELTANKRVTVTSADIENYQNFKSPQVISEIPTTYTETEWYQWNTAQDLNPTDFSKTETALPSLTQETPATPETETTTPETDNFDEKPTITSPETSPFTIKKDAIKISGTAPKNAQKIIIVTQENGKDDEYALRSFQPSDTTWNYTAATQYGNLKSGKNEFTVYAEFENGTRSKPASIVIILENSEENSATPDN